jgi:beta-1,4-mannosyltransferase
MSTPRDRFIFFPEKPPGQISGNSYTDLMVTCWERSGYRHVFMPRGRKEILQALKDRGKTVCVANWIENCLISPGGRITLRGLWHFLKIVFKLHLVGKHVVFARHNVYPHAAKGRSRQIAEMVIDLSELFLFHRVYVLSRHYTSRIRKFVSHPTYEFSGSTSTERPSDDIIYFGNFAPYKNLESLISSWNRRSRLIIAGECRDANYLDSLKSLSAGKNIQFVANWLSDDEAKCLVSSCAAMIIPHSGCSMIISSSVFFALSCGVPAICCGSAHARQLVSESLPGVIYIHSLAEINDLDIAKVNSLDRNEIEEVARSRFGIDAVAEMIKEAMQ